MNNRNEEINIDVGTINFWIKENQIDFSDGVFYPLATISNEKGSIFILKDADNKIKFFYVYIGRGRTDVEWDCSKLNKNERHMVTVTWSQEEKEIKLFIDGGIVGSSKIY